MRISNQMMANRVTAQLSKQVELMAKTQEQIVTQKRINRASDDPVGISSVLSYRKTISGLEQYNDNISQGKLRLDTVDNVLEMVTEMLREAKNIAYDSVPEMRTSLAEDVASIRDQVLQMANYQIDGKYLFSGDSTEVEPYNSTTWAYNGGHETKDIIIGENMRASLTADGESIFGPDGDNVFDILNDLEQAMLLPDEAAIEDQIARLDSAVDNITTIRTREAGVYKRLEATENHNEYFKVNVQEMLSQTEDTDMAEAIINFQVQQTAYESTLSTSAMILQKSLIDFLR
jgi:flagellar hook-associated protein 3 FlgL